MAEQDHKDTPDRKDVEELRKSAKSMGVDDADRKDAEEIVEDVRHTQTDSETSPSGWKAAREEE